MSTDPVEGKPVGPRGGDSGGREAGGGNVGSGFREDIASLNAKPPGNLTANGVNNPEPGSDGDVAPGKDAETGALYGGPFPSQFVVVYVYGIEDRCLRDRFEFHFDLAVSVEENAYRAGEMVYGQRGCCCSSNVGAIGGVDGGADTPATASPHGKRCEDPEHEGECDSSCGCCEHGGKEALCCGDCDCCAAGRGVEGVCCRPAF